MPVTDAELAELTATHDIITLGTIADEVRRDRHRVRTTFVRVADITVAPGASGEVPAAAGERRIVGTPESSAAAVARVKEVAAAGSAAPISGFSLADLEALALAEKITLRSLLEQMAAAGLELVAEAPFDRLRDARRSI